MAKRFVEEKVREAKRIEKEGPPLASGKVPAPADIKSTFYDFTVGKAVSRFRLLAYLLQDGRACVPTVKGSAVDSQAWEFRPELFSQLLASGKYSDTVEFSSPAQARYGLEKALARLEKRGYLRLVRSPLW